MKKFVSLLLALVLCFSLIPCAFAVETVSASDKFTDVPADVWYLDELNYALANGFIAGTSSTTFSPSANITRGQFVTILGRMMGVSPTGGETRFTDVSATSWYAPYVAWAADKGFVSGTSSTTFAPDALITFEQMGTILANYISKTGAELKGYTASAEYKDASSISGWAAANMEVMRKYGLLPTDANGNVNPQRPVNRAEGTVSLVRLARATGLGVEPVIQQKPVVTEKVAVNLVNQPVLADKGVTYADLISGEYQFVDNHRYDDITTIDNNVRYMFQNELVACAIDMSDVGSLMRGSLSETGFSVKLYGVYLRAVAQYPEFGYDSVFSGGVVEDGGVVKGSTVYHDVVHFVNSTYSDKSDPCRDANGNIVKNEELSNYLDGYNLLAQRDDLSNYKAAALQKAIEVHDALWASGKITNTMTQKQKARVYYDWLITNCKYDWADANYEAERPISHIAYGALVDGLAVCQGYTAAYNLLLRLEGIDCRAVNAVSVEHMWTVAILDGVSYHIDSTYGSSSGQANKYFGMTEDAAWARYGAGSKEFNEEMLKWSFGC